MNDSSRKVTFLFVMGSPGSGKTTLINCLSNIYASHPIKFGKILREISNQENDISIDYNEYFKDGSSVPSYILREIVRHSINKHKVNLYLFDGLPRDMSHFPIIQYSCSLLPKYYCKVIGIYLNIETKVAMKRLIGRGELNKSKSSNINGENTRNDDNSIKIINKRLSNYLKTHNNISHEFSRQYDFYIVNGNLPMEEIIKQVGLFI